MSTILSISLLAVQVIAAIPDAPLKLEPLYLSSQQETTSKLSAPATMAVARSGNIYVFDDGNSRIVKVDSHGKFSGEFGQSGSGLERAGLNDSIAVDETKMFMSAIRRVQKF